MVTLNIADRLLKLYVRQQDALEIQREQVMGVKNQTDRIEKKQCDLEAWIERVEKKQGYTIMIGDGGSSITYDPNLGKKH